MEKELVGYLVHLFDVKKVNWGLQMKLAKSLLTKYNFNEIIYALDYYKNKGEKIYSLGFLLYKNNMKDPVSLYHAEKNVQEDNNSSDRNWERIKQNRKTECRTDYPCSLFEEPASVD